MRIASTSLCIVVGLACTARGEHPAGRPTLKEAFSGDFLVGAALNTAQSSGQAPDELALAQRQFNSITPEAVLQWDYIHYQPEGYNFAPADQFVALGEKYDMFIVGHVLVWEDVTPKWVFEDEAGNPVDRETLLSRMRDHIHAVVGRYKGRIKGWDVVNEAIDDDGSRCQNAWQRIIGEDYIEKAFQYAHEADPDSELYYNDYCEWYPAKKIAFANLVRDLQSKGIRIDGIGLQGHWGLESPSLDEMEAVFEDYGKLGVKIMITELDIGFLPEVDPTQNGKDISELSSDLDPYADGLPDKMEEALADRYAEIFACFHRHRDKIDRVTFWGVYDGQSWLNYWPVRGRSAYPLLFDRELQPKPAFDAVIRTAKQPQ